VCAIGYVRVSTADQGASDLRLDAQRVAITDACPQHGWEFVDVLVDSGLSAKTTWPEVSIGVPLQPPAASYLAFALEMNVSLPQAKNYGG
jgi:hypothetical protein